MTQRSPRLWGLTAGLVALLIAAEVQGQSVAQSSAQVPWDQIEAGLASGDAKAAKASFRKARKADASGLAELLSDLTEAYITYHRLLPPKGIRGDAVASLRVHQLLAAAYRQYEHRRIPPALLGDAVARIRPLLAKTPPANESPPFLRPLLCHLRLLAGDQTNLEGQPIVEPVGGVMPASPGLFTPSPPFIEQARIARVQGDLVVEVIADAEGCIAWEKVLKSLPHGLDDQALATLRWHVYEPMRREGVPVARRFVLISTFRIS